MFTLLVDLAGIDFPGSNIQSMLYIFDSSGSNILGTLIVQALMALHVFQFPIPALPGKSRATRNREVWMGAW